MEIVDVLDTRKEFTGQTADKHNIPTGYYRQSVHIWIINNEGQLLLQQRLSTAHKFPNMWSNTGGGVKAGETSLEGAVRELQEELGVTIKKEDLEFIASYKRIKDYADVWLLKKNINISDIVMNEEEVQNVKWASFKDFEEMIKKGHAVKSSYDYLKLFINDNKNYKVKN